MPVLVSTDWLAGELGGGDVRPVDGTWHMPQLRRDARREFVEAHIPGAAFFDIDAIADTSVDLPHMLPDPALFARAVGEMGIGDGDRVVVYDTRGVVSAARVWWMFRVFGHERVAVLDGGLRRWRAEGRPLGSGEPRPRPRPYTPRVRPELVRGLDEVRAALAGRRELVLDARSRGRFAGTEPEPRPGLRGGHMPGARNLPYEDLYQGDGTLLPPAELRQRFAAAGVTPERAVITTCGSGVTACILALALHLIGRDDVAVYDGSWTEWAQRPELPAATGPDAPSSPA